MRSSYSGKQGFFLLSQFPLFPDEHCQKDSLHTLRDASGNPLPHLFLYLLLPEKKPVCLLLHHLKVCAFQIPFDLSGILIIPLMKLPGIGWKGNLFQYTPDEDLTARLCQPLFTLCLDFCSYIVYGIFFRIQNQICFFQI